ncbi:DNA cytosine methyltransferase [Lysobacter humi (ex Lee et al. 2017)]
MRINARQSSLSKISRLRTGAAPRALELCAGCGGLSLGLQAAGFEMVAHVESDAVAAATYARNFAPPEGLPRGEWDQARDMLGTHPEELVRALGLAGDAKQHFDLLVAGLPCQAFARIGRSKLRAVTGDDNAFKNDARAKLYERFLEFVDAVEPLAVLIENVPDILNFGGQNIAEVICENLEARGYKSRYSLLNSAFYGVPQMRERFFLVALHESLGQVPTFPEPTHFLKLPGGYGSARTVALKHVPKSGSRYVPAPVASDGLTPAVTTSDALRDLPEITDHLRAPDRIRRRKLADRLSYRHDAEPSEYARLMRTWLGTTWDTSGHLIRLTPRDYPIFGKMTQGGDYPHAHKVALKIFERAMESLSPTPRPASKTYRDLWARIVPPYDPSKFPNKWWKLDPSLPSRTLTAHMGKDTYSHIHWDSRQKRTVSVREAARLQSFPDAFEFAGAMNAAFRQIGNAVPPILARAVGERLHRDILAGAVGTAKVA